LIKGIFTFLRGIFIGSPSDMVMVPPTTDTLKADIWWHPCLDTFTKYVKK
jgi:hypothetical protein